MGITLLDFLSDQQTKAAENAESLKRTVKQLEKSLQEKICKIHVLIAKRSLHQQNCINACMYQVMLERSLV